MHKHKFNPEHIEKLLGEERRKSLDPAELLKKEGLKKGDTFADVGCGPGFFTVEASQIVGPSGEVYGIDTQVEMLKELKKRCASANIIAVKSDEARISVDTSTVDFALLAYMLHEADEIQPFLKEVKRIIKPGGKILVIDWKKRRERKGPPQKERLSKAVVLRQMKDAGFTGLKLSSISTSFFRVAGFKP